MPRCKRLKVNGQQCVRDANKNSQFCWQHQKPTGKQQKGGGQDGHQKGSQSHQNKESISLNSQLIKAALGGDVDEVEKLLELGADPFAVDYAEVTNKKIKKLLDKEMGELTDSFYRNLHRDVKYGSSSSSDPHQSGELAYSPTLFDE